jgi:hypothetical protein
LKWQRRSKVPPKAMCVPADLCGTVAGWSSRRGACQQRERHSKSLSYLTGAGYVLSAVSVLVVAQPSSEDPEKLANYSVYC